MYITFSHIFNRTYRELSAYYYNNFFFFWDNELTSICGCKQRSILDVKHL